MTTWRGVRLIWCLAWGLLWPAVGPAQESPTDDATLAGTAAQIESLAETDAAPGTVEEQETAREPDIAAHDVLYVSDRFFFVGQDGRGRVVLSLQSGRGRDGSQWQAKHLGVVHEEERGWIELKGSGTFTNTRRELLTIPDSEAYEFQGGPAYGFIITSTPNALTLRIGPIVEHLSRAQPSGVHRMGSAAAVLGWGARVIEGRVIYEHRLIPDYNPLNRVYVGTWKDFQGFFVRTESGHDFYVHRQETGRLSPLLGEQDGFHATAGKAERLQDAEVKVLSHELALGAYRWPTQWRIQWQGENGVRMAELTLIDQHVMSNWVVGGAALGIVEGKLNDGRSTHTIYGLAELLM